MIDEPLEKKYLFRIIKGAFTIIWFHMTLIEGFIQDFSKLFGVEKSENWVWWIHRMKILFFLVMSFIQDFFYIFLRISESFIEHLIGFMEFFVFRLKEEGHCIEKKGNVEDCIEHSKALPFYWVWNHISEADRRRRNHREIKCIKIIPILCFFEMMNKDGSNKPTGNKKNSNNLKFIVWAKFVRHRQLA